MRSILKCCSRKDRLEGDGPRIMVDSQIIGEEEIYDLAESKSIPREKPQEPKIKEQESNDEPRQQELFARSQLVVEKNLKEVELEDKSKDLKQSYQKQAPQEEMKNSGIVGGLNQELLPEIQRDKDQSMFLTESLVKSLDIPLGLQESRISQIREPSVIEQTLYLSTISKNMEDSQVQKGEKEPNPRKINPFSKNASIIKQTMIKENTLNQTKQILQTSFRSLKPTEQVYAERYGIRVTVQNLNEFKAGSTNLGPVLNFYLRYLEEKTTEGIQVPKIQFLKAVGSDFYRSYVLEKNWKNATKYFRQNAEPLISQFEKIIFLVHIKATDRWYLAVYSRSQGSLSIMTPEEKKKQLTSTIREVLNWDEKRGIANCILRFFDQDYVEKMSKPLPFSAVTENYLTDLPLCTKPENYGFHVLEMMRRVFYNYELSTDFSNEAVEKFKLRFCEFIGFFGRQPDDSKLLADPFI